jgi:predicted RNase H-like HicB family nuclease
MSIRYAVVIEKAANNYAAYVPDLDGCIATGETIEKTERLIREAIELHLRAMKEIGEPIPDPTSLAREVEVSAVVSPRWLR